MLQTHEDTSDISDETKIGESRLIYCSAINIQYSKMSDVLKQIHTRTHYRRSILYYESWSLEHLKYLIRYVSTYDIQRSSVSLVWRFSAIHHNVCIFKKY